MKNNQRVTNQRKSIRFRQYWQVQKHYLCFFVLLAVIGSLLSQYQIETGLQPVQAQTCPKLSCNKDQVMNESGICFIHSKDDPVTQIKLQKCENTSTKCYIEDGKPAWISSELQFQSAQKREVLADPTKHSQIYGKITKAKCTATASN